MVRPGRKTRQSLSSSSSNEGSSSTHANKRPNLGATPEVEEMAATAKKDETPSLGDVWKILKEIKMNTEKVVQEVETLKGNYEDLKESLIFTQSQVEEIIQENKDLKS